MNQIKLMGVHHYIYKHHLLEKCLDANFNYCLVIFLKSKVVKLSKV